MKSPFSRADRAWRAVALLQQAARQRDTRGSAVEPVAHTLSAPWGGIAARAGGLIGAHAAGGRGRGAQREPTAGTSRAPRRVRIPHLSRSTSVCQRCMHSNDVSIYYLCVGLFGGGIAECHSTREYSGCPEPHLATASATLPRPCVEPNEGWLSDNSFSWVARIE